MNEVFVIFVMTEKVNANFNGFISECLWLFKFSVEKLGI
jgi:hypothetical protein